MIQIIGTVSFIVCCLFVLHQMIGHILYFFRYSTLHHKFYPHYDGAIQYFLNVMNVFCILAIVIDVVCGAEQIGVTFFPAMIAGVVATVFVLLEGSYKIVNFFSNIRDNFPER